MTAADAPAGAQRPDAGASDQRPEAGDQRPEAGADVGPGALTIRITTAGVSDTEVAAITVALVAATGTGTAGRIAVGPPAWRHAGMLEAATDRRVRTPAELRPPA